MDDKILNTTVIELVLFIVLMSFLYASPPSERPGGSERDVENPQKPDTLRSDAQRGKGACYVAEDGRSRSQYRFIVSKSSISVQKIWTSEQDSIMKNVPSPPSYSNLTLEDVSQWGIKASAAKPDCYLLGEYVIKKGEKISYSRMSRVRDKLRDKILIGNKASFDRSIDSLYTFP